MGCYLKHVDKSPAPVVRVQESLPRMQTRLIATGVVKLKMQMAEDINMKSSTACAAVCYEGLLETALEGPPGIEDCVVILIDG